MYYNKLGQRQSQTLLEARWGFLPSSSSSFLPSVKVNSYSEFDNKINFLLGQNQLMCFLVMFLYHGCLWWPKTVVRAMNIWSSQWKADKRSNFLIGDKMPDNFCSNLPTFALTPSYKPGLQVCRVFWTLHSHVKNLAPVPPGGLHSSPSLELKHKDNHYQIPCRTM